MKKELLYRFFQGKTTLQEETEIREWTEESPEHFQTLVDERKIFDAMILLTDEKQVFSSHQTIFRKDWFRELTKAAAIIAVVLLSVVVYHHYQDKNDISASVMQKITVPSGQRISLDLPDGTVVWLNSRSTITYAPVAFTKNERKIQLDGEAYFEVVSDKKRPFTVETTNGKIEVLGTKFYVEAYADNNAFETALIEGSVKLTRGKNQLYLKPNQMAYLVDDQLTVSNIKDYSVYRWTEGLICFTDETFPNIMKKFEMYYGVSIQIDNKKVENYRCTGKFRQSDGILYALRVLQKDVRFNFERDEENAIIYIK